MLVLIESYIIINSAVWCGGLLFQRDKVLLNIAGWSTASNILILPGRTTATVNQEKLRSLQICKPTSQPHNLTIFSSEKKGSLFILLQTASCISQRRGEGRGSNITLGWFIWNYSRILNIPVTGIIKFLLQVC